MIRNWTTKEGKLTEVKPHPIDLAQKGTRSQRGILMLSGSDSNFEHIAHLSKPYGTEITTIHSRDQAVVFLRA